MDVRATITRLLEATAQGTALKTRIDTLRAELHAEAVRRYEAEGAAPTWSVRGLGKVALTGADADRPAVVADALAFRSWVAERRPDVVTTTLTLPTGKYAAALEALTFAGVPVDRVEQIIDPTWQADYLADLDVEELPATADGGPTVLASTPDGELVPGIRLGAAPAPGIRVNLDPERKRAAILEAEAELEAEEERDGTFAAGAMTPQVPGQTAIEDHLASRGVDTPTGTAVITDVPSGPPAGAWQPASAHPAGIGTNHRNPYVGTGADGARRSAQIDREELDGLAQDDPRRGRLELSARLWDQQAEHAEQAEAFAAERLAESQGLPAGVTPLAPPLSDEELAIAARFEEGALTPEQLDADQAQLRREAVEQADALVAGAITLEVHDATITPVADWEADLPPVEPLGVTDGSPQALDKAAAEDTLEDVEPGSPAAAHAARRVLEVTLANDTALGSAKVERLRELAQVAGIPIPKARLGKAALAQLIRDRITATQEA